LAESFVAHDPASDDGLHAAGLGDGRGAGEGFQTSGAGEAGSVVTDLGEDAGAEHGSEAGEAGDDLGVGVLIERSLELLLEPGHVGDRGVSFPTPSSVLGQSTDLVQHGDHEEFGENQCGHHAVEG
jgi:hypothetical protein